MLGLRLQIVLIAGLSLAIDSKFLGFPSQDEEDYENAAVMRVQGTDDETGRVIHGNQAKEGMFPWTVALFANGIFACTGSIISEHTVLTAGHCVNNDKSEPLPVDIFVGVIGTVYSAAADATRITFRKFTSHPRFKYVGLLNDVAVLETTDPIIFNDKVQPICLPSDGAIDLTYQKVKIMGWGIQFRGTRSMADFLQYDDQIIYPNDHCSRLYGNVFQENKICVTGLEEVYSGVCHGDSGGPLVFYEEDGKPVQVGIVSHGHVGEGCGSPLGPDAFSRVTFYIDFIKGSASGKLCLLN